MNTNANATTLTLTPEPTKEAGILLNQGDISCLVSAASEIMDGLANSFYGLTLDGLYAAADCHTLEERQEAGCRYFENTFEITSGAIHLAQFMLQKIWEELDHIHITPRDQ